MTALLRVAQVVADTEAEGPGRRFAIWVQGCSLRCPGCCNPEMFAADRGGSLVDTQALITQILGTPGIEGISLLGGEPFEQPAPLAQVSKAVRERGLSVMVFTGYTLAELKEKQSEDVDALLGATDVLVDGRFQQGMPDTKRRWIGSENQQIHFLSDRYQLTDPRFGEPNTIELRWVDGKLTINGWPSAADGFRRR